MKFKKILVLSLLYLFFSSCASGYKNIDPSKFNYISNDKNEKVTFSYKYDILNKKYSKKEAKNDVKLVAVKVTNSSENELIIGDNLELIYGDGNRLTLLENKEIFKSLKQSPASYLWYLLLTPTQFYTTSTNSNGYTEQTSSFPIGVIIGPGIAGGNMLAASSANKKFKQDLLYYNLLGKKIKPGETVYGLIGIRSKIYNSIYIKLK
nr:hypothetical protein [uncultured Flavobacterium sp.]